MKSIRNGLFNLLFLFIHFLPEFIEHLRNDIHIDRFISQSPKELLIAPDWRLKNHEFRAKLEHRLAMITGQ